MNRSPMPLLEQAVKRTEGNLLNHIETQVVVLMSTTKLTELVLCPTTNKK